MSRSRFHVKKRTLLAIAGGVWLLAGLNVVRMGVIAYYSLAEFNYVYLLLSVIVMSLFGTMFYKLSLKHTSRIKAYPNLTRPFWHFFDLKSYIIMAVMMSGGVSLRVLGVLPTTFVAFFYTGVGAALMLAGAMFFCRYARFTDDK